jgi:hypothetical protein
MNALARRLERSLGRTGVVGAGLLVAGIAFWLGGVQPMRASVDRLHAVLAQAERAAPARAPRRPEDALASFYGYFVSREEAFAALSAIYTAADAEGLSLDTGEYRLSRDRGARLLRYQIVLPVKGSYPKIRQFVARALNEAPGIALEDLSLRRENAQSNVVEARVQLALYIGADR